MSVNKAKTPTKDGKYWFFRVVYKDEFNILTAQASKAQAALLHFAATLTGRLGAKGFGDLHLHQVCNAVTTGADKMHMWVCVSIEAFHTMDGGNHTCQPLLPEQIQIPVYSTHRQIRDLLL